MLNSLYYSGTIKKKYTVADIMVYIKAFADEKGLSYKLKAENEIVVDFGRETDCMLFMFEGQQMPQMTVEHSVDEEQHFILMYELLYGMRGFFSKLEVGDESAIWDEYCYSKESVQIQMKALTEEQRELIKYMDFSQGCDATSVMFSVIALYTWNRGGFVEECPGDWNTMLLKIPKEFRCKGHPMSVIYMIQMWIRETMSYKGKPVKDYAQDDMKIQTAMGMVAFALQECICDVWAGSAGKKQTELVKMFQYEDRKRKKLYDGKGMRTSVEAIMCFMFTALEHVGFTITEKVEFPKEKIVTGNLKYGKVIDF